MKEKNQFEGRFKTITRGGQLLLHDLHMIGQVLYKLLLWLLPVWMLALSGWFVLITDNYQRYLAKEWCWAKICLFADNTHHQQMLIRLDGHTIKVYSSQIVTAPFIQEAVKTVQSKLEQSFWVGFLIYFVTVIAVTIWLRRRGKSEVQEKRIKGDYLASINEVKKLMRQKGKISNFAMGIEQLPLPLGSEMQHTLFHGTTGSGKSTGIKLFLDMIRSRGERAILYDKSCNLVEQFYQPEGDQLMNPLDERSCDWDLWQECRDKADFDNLASALIPAPSASQDPFWVNAARTIFAAATHRMASEKKPKILDLLRYLLTANVNELHSLLKGTEAETLMSEKAEKTAISIKAVLATYLKSLCYIKDGENPFSIRQWIQDDQDKNWLFISSLGDKHESLKPLITAWLDIAVNALLSLSPNPNRRIWIILDELASLHQLPYLTTALSEARKFGGCFIIGIQSYAQLAKVYGHEGAKEISSLLNTRFMFRVPDPDIAQWSAKNLGETILEEVREGISYGANSIRDGVSLQRMEREKPVVSYSDILRLEDLSCYIRLSGNYPIAKIHLSYQSRLSINAPFEEREIKYENLQNEMRDLAGSFEDQCSSDESISYSKKEILMLENSAQKKKIRKKIAKIDERLFE